MNKYLMRFVLNDGYVKRKYEECLQKDPNSNINIYKCIADAYNSSHSRTKVSRKQAEEFVTHKFLKACYVNDHKDNRIIRSLEAFYYFRPSVIPFWYKVFIKLKYTFKGHI